MAKNSKIINFSEKFENVNAEFSDLLRQTNNGTDVSLLKENDLKKFKNYLISLIQSNNEETSLEENVQILRSCLELLLCILSSNINNNVKLEFFDIMKYLNADGQSWTDQSGVKNLISKVNECWMIKIQTAKEIQGMEYLTLKHLLNLCTSERPLVSDVQRLNALRKTMTAVPFDKTVPSLRPLLIKLVQKPQVLSSEHGQRFIAQALILSQKIMMEIHKTVMLDLSSCSKKKACDYGKVYILAWHAASDDIKLNLQKSCFQHVMETMLKEQRLGLELSKISQNILTVLEVWHSERKKKNPAFITMITDAYQPILWKHLQSGFNVHRCNAIDVFFKAFPLQRSHDSSIEAETLFNKQFNTMLASLTDDCHIVRIIGIREVCNILSLYWNSFSPIQIQNLMTVITKQNAYDVSSAEVRKTVYLGFQNLVKSELSREYVKQILPNLSNNIHDVNQKVRVAFFQLLICVKELKDPNFKYSDCVSMFNIQYRLAEESIYVGQWIVKLLLRNYYHSKMSVVEWTKRFIYLIKTYRNSYRNFFFYSNKSLPFIDACTIIYEILTQIGGFVLSKLGADVEENKHREKLKEKKKEGKRKSPLSEQNENRVSSESENSLGKKCAFDDPDVVSGLFDIVTILWVLHDPKLSKPENEEIRYKLYDTYIKYAQPLINYYKDCDLFLGVISLSGNIPAALLRNNSITLPGYCIKMLKSIKIEGSEEENEKIVSMLIALVKWGRGNEILEQITLWLDAAFETKDMNETILPRRRVKISETIQPNSIVAINILDTLFKKEYVKLSILKKNYNDLFSLWKFMSRIKKLIENRIDEGEPFEEDLVSDEFLNRCFQRYVKLIPLLKEDEKNDDDKENKEENRMENLNKVSVNRQKEIENVIEWGENFLLPLLQDDNLKEMDAILVTRLLKDILHVGDNMIIVHMVNNSFHFKIAHFVLKLLATKYAWHFLKAASRITVAINFSAKLLFKVRDDLEIFSTVIPSLLSHILDTVIQQFSFKQMEQLTKDLPTMKMCFGKILATYQDNLSSGAGLKENVRKLKLVVCLFVDCILNLISQQIPREDSTIPIYSLPSQLPVIASVLFSLFHNRKIWNALFLHVLNTKLTGKSLKTKDTISCILILNMYAVSDKKLKESEVQQVLDCAKKHLTELKETLIKNKVQLDNIFKESDTTMKNTLNAATKGKSGTVSKLDSIFGVKEVESSKERGFKEDTNENHESSEKSEIVQSFLCEADDLEMDFINCGFEIIKNLTSLKERSLMEVDDS